MANETKTCSLTENEINSLIQYHGGMISADNDTENRIERLIYLNKRLKAFKEPETETKPTPAVAGWGAPTT